VGGAGGTAGAGGAVGAGGAGGGLGMGGMGGSIVSLLPVARGGGMGSDLKNGLLPPLVGRRRIRARRSSFCLRACSRTRSFSSSGSITGGAGVDGAGFITAGATTGGLPTGERGSDPGTGLAWRRCRGAGLDGRWDFRWSSSRSRRCSRRWARGGG
jgi:hypothetical protein